MSAWRESVLAAEAKKAGIASEVTRLLLLLLFWMTARRLGLRSAVADRRTEGGRASSTTTTTTTPRDKCGHEADDSHKHDEDQHTDDVPVMTAATDALHSWQRWLGKETAFPL